MQSKQIDSSLYSRQLYAIGADAMEALRSSSVLILGMTGLGVEVAKCVILTGVSSVTLCDGGKIRYKELSSNYYARESDVGKNRVDVVAGKISSLNPYVTVKTELVSQLNEEHFKQNNIIVICDGLFLNQIVNNKYARQYGTKFIMANTFGVMCTVFCDFGDNFIVNDSDGELVKTGIITQVEGEKFITHDHHKLYIGDYVSIKSSDMSVSGKVQKIYDLWTFSVEGNDNMTPRGLTGGSFVQVKQPTVMNFKSLEESIVNPEFVTVISSDFDRPKLLHNFHTALNMYINTHKKFPTTPEEIQSMENMTCFDNDKHREIYRKLCYTCSGKLCPIDSIVGSIVAQEVMKGISKKYTPINQWLYLDFSEIIPEISEFENKGHYTKTRYESQVSVLGEALQKKISDANIFIVGAGAIGCELLKILAMMGVGNIQVTDMDKIEKSNLNRQFLFRNENIGHFKSEAARDAILKMNPDVNIVAHILKVAPETNNVFDTQFYSGLTSIMTALDNVNARLFVDRKCVENGCHLIDSGTLGTQGNVQVVVPYVTESYASSNDPPETSIPVCTLKMFPYQPEHCIQYAKNLFCGMFTNAPQNFMRYKNNPAEFYKMTPDVLAEPLEDILFVVNNAVFHSKECIKFAYNMWHIHFRDQIYHLVEKFPKDAVTADGTPFWIGTKKFPNVHHIDSSDIHVDFIESAANLWADVFGLQHVTRKQVITFLAKAKVPEIKKQKGEITVEVKKEGEKEAVIKEVQPEPLSTEDYQRLLPDPLSLVFNVAPIEFEKDDDTNFHIDFITSASNLRASSYGIEQTDKFKTKGIAGKIIPALVTTTSLVSGLACIELIKILAGVTQIETYANSFVNLGISFFGFSEPNPCKKFKMGTYEYSAWDNLNFPNIRLQEIMDSIALKIKDIDISTIYIGEQMIFSDMYDDDDKEKLLNTCIGDIYSKEFKKDTPDTFKIEVYMNVNDDSDPIMCDINC
jgi:ubiquitin-activating enzyme E1